MLAERLREIADELVLRGPDSCLPDMIAEGLVGAGGFAQCRVWLRGPGDRCAVCDLAGECRDRSVCLHLAGSGGAGKASSPCRCALSGGAHGLAASTSTVIVSNSGGRDARFLDALRLDDAAAGTTALVPLGFNRRNLGVLEVSMPEAFSDEAIQALQGFARRCAAVIGIAGSAAELRERLERLGHENRSLREEILSSKHFEQVLGTSAAIRELRRRIDCAAGHDGPVLLTGPSGVGKELVARTIHARSTRALGPVLRVQCGSKESEAVECELFGHEENTFACAPGRRPGKIELADGGTLLIDPIDRLCPSVQARLVEVMRTGSVSRLGASAARRVSVRFIASTTRDLEEAGGLGSLTPYLRDAFRAHLVSVPALKDRREDIPMLVEHYVRRFARQFDMAVPPIDEADLAGLKGYDWPGNVRELRQVVERAVIASDGGRLVFEGLVGGTTEARGREAEDQSLAAVERAHIVRVLGQTGGVIEGREGAAAILGLNPSTLRSRMGKLGIPRRPAS